MDTGTTPNPNPYFVYSAAIPNRPYAVFMAECPTLEAAQELVATFAEFYSELLPERHYYIYHADQDRIVWDSAAEGEAEAYRQAKQH